MKTITLARKAYQAAGDLSEARLWKAVRKDGQVFTFGSTDRSVVFDSRKYSAEVGVNPSAVSNSATLAVDNHELSGYLNATSLTERDITAGLWDGATIYVVDVNYRNVTQGKTIIASGFVGNISAGRLGFNVECRSLSQMLSQNLGRTVTPYCDADVFDARCGLDPAPYRVTGSVTATTDRKHFSDTTRLETPPWFNYGLITWTSGENEGLSQEIKTHTASGDFTLQLRMPFPIEVGDEYEMLPGCNKLLNLGASGDTITASASSNNLPPDTFTASGFTQSSGFYNNAILTWLSGQNTGTVVHVTTYVSDGNNATFTLSASMSGGINPGDQFTLAPDPNVAGTFIGLPMGDCKAKYNNVVNFRGFPHVPGMNRTWGDGNAPA